MIYTFYSYKGGVGRTMALANVAELFYQAGFKVLMVDWDLEAPGLERFFPVQTDKVLEHPGVMDMLLDYKRRMAQRPAKEAEAGEPALPLDGIEPYLVDMYPNERSEAKLWLLATGKRSGEHFAHYANLVRTFDWRDFYQNWEGELFFEWLRRQFLDWADVVLIDSRTGVTEIGGVCTYQLADVVIMFCAPNRQSLEGTYEMAHNFKHPEVGKLRRGRPLEVLVVPARVEDRAETRLLNEFRREFIKRFGEFMPEALPDEATLLWQLKIPHVPYYAFKEIVAVREKGEARSEDMVEAFASLAKVMAEFAPQEAWAKKVIEFAPTLLGPEAVIAEGVIALREGIVGRDQIELTPSEADLLREMYLQEIVRICQYLPLSAIDVGSADPGRATRISLSPVYVDLETRTPPAPEAEVKPAQAHRLSALETVANTQRVVLLGDPGSGKTVFLNYLALQLALHQLEKGESAYEITKCSALRELLPIRIAVRDFAAKVLQSDRQQNGSRFLWNYIVSDLTDRQLGKFVPYISRALKQGQALLLVDGLDEAASIKARQLVKESLLDFVERYPEIRIVVTCRTISYHDPEIQLPYFKTFELAPFNEEQINRFIDAWYTELGRLAAVRVENAEALAHRLRAVVRYPDLRRLASNPLLLTVIALVHTHKGRLPEARALLYEETIDILLWRWEQLKAGGEEAPRLRRLLLEAGRSDVDVKRVLWNLAFHVHRESSGELAIADIDELTLVKSFARLHPEEDWGWARQVVQQVKEQAGLLVERAPSVYAFSHRTFQEYLAGASLSVQPDFAQRGAVLIEEGVFWREVILLAVGRLVYLSGEVAKPLALVGELCPARATDDDLAWRKVWLAGDVLVEIGVNRVRDSILGRDLANRVRDRLADLLGGGYLSPVERAASGRTLSRLGDPRFRPDAWHLPDEPLLGFVEIPAGPVLLGTPKKKIAWLRKQLGVKQRWYNREKPQHRVDVPTFYISRYPITVAQFKAFVETGGYQEQRFWTAEGWAWKKSRRRTEPVSYGEPFDLPNHPVVGVTWYEALAYCAWLTEQLRAWEKTPEPLAGLLQEGWRITLPSEAEWEKAARGTDDRIYPWGNEPDADRANYNESGIGSVSTVGCFPGGASPYGVEDMAGNVWEWTRSLYKPYPYNSSDGRENLEAKGQRAVRGGGFDNPQRTIRCAVRGREETNVTRDNLGFRIVVAPSEC